MEKKNVQYFKYRYTPLMLTLMVVAYLLCGVGIALSVLRAVRSHMTNFLDALNPILLIGVCVFCIVTLTCMLIKSQYFVENDCYYTQFGFIKSKFSIASITSMILEPSTNKLTVYNGEQYYTHTLSALWRDAFIKALLAIKPDIEYSFALTQPKEKQK